MSAAGYRCSAGISRNKTLAKLASGLHKPDNQTILPPAAVDGFLARLPVGSLPGCGYVADRQLKALEVRRVRERESGQHG